MPETKKKIIIIGGGAAGFFTAANLNSHKFDILLLEQAKKPMQKIKISGGGRCNVTNACFDPHELITNYPRGHKELRGVFTKFQPGDTIAWFEERGLPLKTEADNRMFPITNSSESVMDILLREALSNQTNIQYQSGVQHIDRKDGKWLVQTKKQTYTADSVVFCTGSSPKAYQMLSQLDLKLVDLVPSLFTFNIKDKALNDLMGTSFPEATVKIPKLKTEETGPLLITHWGLSGPAVLKLSAWCARKLFKLNYQFDVWVNFLNIPLEQANQMFLAYKEMHSKKSIGQAKIFGITQRFWQYVLDQNQIDFNKQIANISKKEKRAILQNLCEQKFQVNGKSTFKEEFVTAGGVSLKEIDFKTMQTKNLPNFYLAGEVLNIDAVTGGFNFQACWSEAWLIAQDLNNNA